MKGPPCVECGREAERVGGREIYPHRADLHDLTFWLCICGAYCGSHKATGEPLGYPAGYFTREARKAAHAALDPLWLNGRTTRSEVYAWLAREMGMQPERCHIAMMTQKQAERVVALCRSAHGRTVAETGHTIFEKRVGETHRASEWAGTPTGPDEPPWDM